MGLIEWIKQKSYDFWVNIIVTIILYSCGLFLVYIIGFSVGYDKNQQDLYKTLKEIPELNICKEGFYEFDNMSISIIGNRYIVTHEITHKTLLDIYIDCVKE